MGTALAGMFYSGGGLWLKFILTLAKQGMAKAGYYIVQMIKNGMQNIVDSLQSINPWVKFALDVLQVAVDITSLVITGVDIFRNVDPRRGATFLAKLTTIAQAVFRNQMSGTFGIVVGSLAADLFSFIGTSDSLLNDTETLVSDFNTARDS